MERNSLPWRAKALQDYLQERSLDSLPRDPHEMCDYPAWLNNKGYKATSINSLISYLKDLYKTNGVETRNIIKRPKDHVGALRDPLSLKEMDILLRYVESGCSLRDQLIIKLMVYMGLRNMEISRMDMGDFHNDDSSYTIRLWRKGSKEKSSQLIVVNSVLGIFIEYLNQLDSKNCSSDKAMFIGQKGHRLRPDVVSQIVAKIIKDAGLKDDTGTGSISPHSLRHTAIANTIRKPENLALSKQFAQTKGTVVPEWYASILKL